MLELTGELLKVITYHEVMRFLAYNPLNIHKLMRVPAKALNEGKLG